MQTSLRGRDLAAERVRARVAQLEVANELGMIRSALSFVEREHSPLTAEFAERYFEAVRKCEARRDAA